MSDTGAAEALAWRIATTVAKMGGARLEAVAKEIEGELQVALSLVRKEGGAPQEALRAALAERDEERLKRTAAIDELAAVLRGKDMRRAEHESALALATERARTAEGALADVLKHVEAQARWAEGQWPNLEWSADAQEANAAVARGRALLQTSAVAFLRAETHSPTCGYLNSEPMTGDEASLCDCGAVERAHEAWLASDKPTAGPPASDPLRGAAE